MENYFIITSSEDGLIIEVVDKAGITQSIQDNYESESPYTIMNDSLGLPDAEDSPRREMWIIKGKIIVPEEKKTISFRIE